MDLEGIEREHVMRGVGPRHVYEVVTDYAAYPRLFPELTGARVLATDGAEQTVEFKAKMVLDIRYVLRIRHDQESFKTEWSYVEGEIVTDSRGSWAITGQGPDTNVVYRAALMVKAPLPGFVLNKVTKALLHTSVPNMFKAIEREAQVRARRGPP